MSFRKFKAFTASASIEFKDPDTGHMFKAKTLSELYRNILMYRVQNNLEMIEYLPQVVENYQCSLPCNTGRCESASLERSISQYIRGGIALLHNMAFKKFASQEEAEARASQCVQCPNNVFPDKGAFMAWADDIAIQQVGERRTTRHNELGNCAACSCPLRSKVFIGGPLPAFPEEEVKEMRKVGCWQLRLTGQE